MGGTRVRRTAYGGSEELVGVWGLCRSDRPCRAMLQCNIPTGISLCNELAVVLASRQGREGLPALQKRRERSDRRDVRKATVTQQARRPVDKEVAPCTGIPDEPGERD